jgi:hypothetical protein
VLAVGVTIKLCKASDHATAINRISFLQLCENSAALSLPEEHFSCAGHILLCKQIGFCALLEVRFGRFTVAMQLELQIFFFCVIIWCKAVVTHNTTRINFICLKV